MLNNLKEKHLVTNIGHLTSVYDDFFEDAQEAADKGSFLKLPRYQKSLKYNSYLVGQ